MQFYTQRRYFLPRHAAAPMSKPAIPTLESETEKKDRKVNKDMSVPKAVPDYKPAIPEAKDYKPDIKPPYHPEGEKKAPATADDVKYIWDPEHKNKPEDGNWKETDKGWTRSEPKEPKKKEKKPKTKTEGEGETKTSEPSDLEAKKDTAIKTVTDFYGNLDKGEKKEVEDATAKMVMDFIQKAGRGEEAHLPELSHDSKVKFMQAMFLALKAKQIEGIPTNNPLLAKQKDMVVKELFDTASKALDQVVNEISQRSLTEKHITSGDVNAFLSKPKDIGKKPSDMSAEEYSDFLASDPNSKDIVKAFKRKPNLRGVDFNDLSPEIQQKADYLAYQMAEYGKNFSRLNWSIKENVKYRPRKNSNDFVLGNYKTSPTSVSSDITIPVLETNPQGMAKSLDAVMKKLVALGFEGIIQTDKRAEDIAMNTGTIRVITDDPRHAVAVNEIIKETFGENGISVQTAMKKHMFGMDAEDLMAYRTALKKTVMKSGKSFKLPADEIENYLAAARYAGLDIVHEKGKPGYFNLIPHNPRSEVGKLKIDAQSGKHPKEVLSDLFFAQKQDAANKASPQPSLPEIPIDDPYAELRKTYKDQAEEEPDFSELDNLSPDTEEPATTESEPESAPVSTDSIPAPAETKPVFNADNIEKDTDSVAHKASMKDPTAFQDIDHLVSGMLEDVKNGRNERLYKTYEKSLQKILIGMMTGDINKATPPEISAKIKELSDTLKALKTPAVAKNSEEFKFHDMPNFKFPGPEADSANPILNDKGLHTGWKLGTSSDGKPTLYTSDGFYGLTFDDDAQAKSFARKNPYKEVDKPVQADPLDAYGDEIENDANLKNGARLSISKPVDSSKVESILDKYKMPHHSQALDEMLGFKRYILHNASEEDRNLIRDKGFLAYLSQKDPSKIQQDYLSKMNNYLHGADFENQRALIAKIAPEDFVKILAGLGAQKTASIISRLAQHLLKGLI